MSSLLFYTIGWVWIIFLIIIAPHFYFPIFLCVSDLFSFAQGWHNYIKPSSFGALGAGNDNGNSNSMATATATDGWAIDNPPIRPPDGVVWRSIPVPEGKYVHISDEVDPHCELMFQRLDNILPFIRLPRAQWLNILSHTGHQAIIKVLNVCEKLKRTSLVRSDCKCIFGDYRTKVMYTCAGVQVSRWSCKVLEAAPYMEKLRRKHWRVLMCLIWGAERFPSLLIAAMACFFELVASCKQLMQLGSWEMMTLWTFQICHPWRNDEILKRTRMESSSVGGDLWHDHGSSRHLIG